VPQPERSVLVQGPDYDRQRYPSDLGPIRVGPESPIWLLRQGPGSQTGACQADILLRYARNRLLSVMVFLSGRVPSWLGSRAAARPG
jgi:hypothetical protein